jgi:hypothetical protein
MDSSDPKGGQYGNAFRFKEEKPSRQAKSHCKDKPLGDRRRTSATAHPAIKVKEST